MVTVGNKTVRAHVYVQQQPAALRVTGDTIVRMPEGDEGKVAANLVDARGNGILGATVRWRSADPSVASVDSLGNAVAVAPGKTVFTASNNAMATQLPVEVYPVPSSLTLLSGDGQRAPAGRRVGGSRCRCRWSPAVDGRFRESRCGLSCRRTKGEPSLRPTRRMHRAWLGPVGYSEDRLGVRPSR